MPLLKGKSKKAFEHNVKKEIEAGKPKDQSLAIAYSMQRRNKKKMAKGGMVPSPSPSPESKVDQGLRSIRSAFNKKKGYAEGGEVIDLREQIGLHPEALDEMQEEALEAPSEGWEDLIDGEDLDSEEMEEESEPMSPALSDIVKSIRKKYKK